MRINSMQEVSMGLDPREIFSDLSLLGLLFGLKGGTETTAVWPSTNHITSLVLRKHRFNVPLEAVVPSWWSKLNQKLWYLGVEGTMEWSSPLTSLPGLAPQRKASVRVQRGIWPKCIFQVNKPGQRSVDQRHSPWLPQSDSKSLFWVPKQFAEIWCGKLEKGWLLSLTHQKQQSSYPAPGQAFFSCHRSSLHHLFFFFFFCQAVPNSLSGWLTDPPGIFGVVTDVIW